jgi:DNA-binding CsgD family transcriptional regulator
VADLLERDGELGVIREGLDAAQRGDGCCVVIEGPAGIGKSSLLAVVRAEAVGRGFRVLRAAGGELERDFPHGVIRQLFSAAVKGASSGGRELAGAAKLAQPVLDLDASEHSSQPSGESRLLEALHGLYWLTVNLAADTPLLLVVDDAHWCDSASLQFLVYLRRRLEGLAVLVVVGTRAGEPGADQRLLRLLGGEGRVRTLRPRALSVAAAGALLRRRLAEAPAPEFTAAVHRATGGNPFLLGELVTALVDAQLRPTREAAAEVAAIGPEGVRQAVLRRLAALGEGAGALARALSVLGTGAELNDAATLAALEPAAAASLAESLVRIQVLRDERRLSFAHPLVRAAIYLDLPLAARARLHARAARVLADAGADANAVAAQLLETDPAGDAAVVELLRAGARRGVEQGAMEVAATYLRRAVAEPPTSEVSAAVFRELGAAELAAGRPDAAAAALAAAWARTDDQATGLSIVLLRRHALVLADRIDEAVAVVDEAATRWADPGIADLLEAGALGAGHLDFRVVPDVARRVDALRRRAETEKAMHDPLALAVAAVSSAFANQPISATTQLTARALTALPRAHADSDYSVEGQLAIALYLSEQYELLAEQSSVWLDDARRRGSLPRFISMATTRSNGAYRAGALADAEAGGRDALEAARLYGHHFWLPGVVAAVLNPLVEHGRLDEADALLRESQVEELHGQSHAFCWAVMLLPARARLRIAQGRLEQGLTDLLACGERYESMSNRSPSLWAWRSEAAIALAALGDGGRARELATDELALARAFGGPRALGVALRGLGLVTPGDEGVALLTEAAAVQAHSGAVLEQARVLVDLGSSLRRRGRRSDARQPLRDGLDAAIRCGAEVLAQRARDELLASGAHVGRERLTGPDALTPSERRVAQLAARGQSNPEIAQALFLTRRTVETHLTHAYQKLGISSRDQLSAALD